ncbi:MAG TPA: DUF4097 family beta strand repeat-containing protein [Acidobacteriota bacterium]|nr:DUF4097 family beta strand repeat-containing protein [Acidobacteriota bacterium]
MSRIKVLIVLCFTLLFLAVSCIIAGEEHREDFSKTLPLKAGDRFSLENVNGHVAVATWKDDKVEIKAVKITHRSAEELAKVEIRVEEIAGGVAVKAVWPKFPRRASVSVEFEVKVPEGAVLEKVGTVNGGVDVSGRFERGDVGTTNGNVTIDGGSGELEASTTNGDVRIRDFDGRVEAGTTNGSIRLENLTFKGGLKAGTTNGSITLSFANATDLNADLRAHTTNGHITVDFPVTLKNLTQSRRRVEARIGEGGSLIELGTTNGSIRLTK